MLHWHSKALWTIVFDGKMRDSFIPSICCRLQVHLRGQKQRKYLTELCPHRLSDMHTIFALAIFGIETDHVLDPVGQCWWLVRTHVLKHKVDWDIVLDYLPKRNCSCMQYTTMPQV